MSEPWTWTPEDDTAAAAEGWGLFDAEGDMQIQRIDAPENDDAPYLHGDDEAHEIVMTKAREGSALHLKALRCVSETERALILRHHNQRNPT